MHKTYGRILPVRCEKSRWGIRRPSGLMQVAAMGAKDWTWGLHVQPACCQLQTKRNAVNDVCDEQ
jgi:hypothetical protein